MRTQKPGQRGYSLMEMLVVIAMIGMFSLVTVPQFMNYYRQAKIRGAVRQFNGHLRAARQRAITRNHPVAVSFAPGATPAAGVKSGTYAIFDRSGATWVQVGNRYRLEEPVYFTSSSFATSDAINDTLHDVLFLANGTVSNLPTTGAPTIVMQTNAKVPNNRCTITLNGSGAFTSTLSSF